MQYGIKQYIFVIRELTAREIKRKYSRSVLGILWSVLQPLLFMCIMTFIFSGLLGHDTQYPAKYLSAYIMWVMFNTATTTAMTAFEDNRNMFQKTKLPRELFVVSRVYTSLVNLGFSCIALGIVLVIFKIRPSWTYVFFFVDIFFECIFTVGIAFILATIFVFYKDVKFLWKNATILLVHMIAIYVPLESYPENLHFITRQNPLYMFSNIARDSIVNGKFDLEELFKMIIWSITTFGIGLLVFKVKENEIVKKI